MSKRIALVLGTRPEIIKLSSVIRAFQRRSDIEFTVIHTGQHYSENLSSAFFDQFDLPLPDYNLEVGSDSHGRQTAQMISRIETVLRTEQPDVTIVQGDTNSVMAGSIATDKLRPKLGHVEAGLRCFDREMPEESNRRVADHLSDYLFAPTPRAASQLRREGIDRDRIFVTGNTVVDAIMQNEALAEERSDVLDELGLDRGEFSLFTAHRAENVDDVEEFSMMLEGVGRFAETTGSPIVYPIHPHAKKRLNESDLGVPEQFRLIEPQEYLDFLMLERSAGVIFTDSGGVQEEACVLGVPCVTMRESTERPETVDVGSNRLAGTDSSEIYSAARDMWQTEPTWDNPFGDGTAAEQICDIIEVDADGYPEVQQHGG